MNDRNRTDESTMALKERLRNKLAAQFESIHRRRRSRLRFAARAGVMSALAAIVVAAIWWNPVQRENRNEPGGKLATAVSPEIRNGSEDSITVKPSVNQYSSMTVEFLSDADVEKLLAEQQSDWFIAKVNGEVRAFNAGAKN